MATPEFQNILEAARNLESALARDIGMSQDRSEHMRVTARASEAAWLATLLHNYANGPEDGGVSP